MIPKETPGFHVVRRMDKMGLNTAQMAEIRLGVCGSCGKPTRCQGAGANLFTHSMTWERR